MIVLSFSSALGTKKAGALYGDFESLIWPVFLCSSMKSLIVIFWEGDKGYILKEETSGVSGLRLIAWSNPGLKDRS
jgi:hypothetical protein